MKRIYRIIKKSCLFHYNIGFFDFDEADAFHSQVHINWVKHSCKDVFFADPFILDVTKELIKVLVEEFPYKEWKGRISLLTIARDDYELKSKKTLLELDTHLSFPFIYRTGTNVYVIPENSASGRLNAYRYDKETESLHFESTLVEQPVIDPVIVRQDNYYILFGTLRGGGENSDLFSWQSKNLLKGYALANNAPVKSDKGSGRRGGDFFFLNNELYSATQSCVESYGEALNICKVEELSENKLTEKVMKTLYPDKQYPEGLHTLNTHGGICVVDGLTYLFRPWKKIKVLLKSLYISKS